MAEALDTEPILESGSDQDESQQARKAKELLRQHYDIVFQVILYPKNVATMLYKEKVISEETMEKVTTLKGDVTEQKRELFRAIRAIIAVDHKMLKIFASVLKLYTESTKIGMKLLRHYAKVFPEEYDEVTSICDEDNVTESQANYTEMDVPLSPDFQGRFTKLKFEYVKLLRRVKNRILQLPNQEQLASELKSYLFDCDQDVFSTLKGVDSMEDVLTKVEEAISVTNMSWLEEVVEFLECVEAKDDLEKFQAYLHQVCDNLAIDVCLLQPFKEMFSEPLKCATIKFVLQWDPSEHMLPDIKGVLWKAFGTLFQKVLVYRMAKDNSISITCYAPHTIMDTLMIKAQANLDLLQEMGVISLFIGYYTVLDHHVTDKIDALEKENKLLRDQSNDKSYLESDLEKDITLVEETQVGVLEQHSDVERLKSIILTKQKDANFWKSMLKDKLMPSDDDSNEVTMLKRNQTKLLDRLSDIERKFGEVTAQFESKQEEVDQTRRELSETKEKYSNQNEQLKLLEITLKDEQKKLENSNMTLVRLREELKTSEAKTKVLEKLKRGMSSDLDDMHRRQIQLRDDKKGLQQKVTEHEEELEKTVIGRIPVLLFDSEVHYPPVDVLMTNFSDWKKRRDHWFSPSFYTHHEGYKMCVKVHAYGQENGRGTHVSLYVHLMSGNHDDKLPWPFRGEVKLQLLNRRKNNNHKEYVVPFDESCEEESCQRVTNGLTSKSGISARVGEGSPQFIKHEDLAYNPDRGTEYLHDDSLLIRVSEVIRPMEATIPKFTDHSGSEIQEPSSKIPKFTMQHFSRLKASNEEWKSEPFFSHEGGYKFILVAYANGKGSYKGRSVSIYAHLVKGENDSQLSFPFRGQLVIQIINCIEDKHHAQIPIDINDTTDPNGKTGARVKTLSLDNLINGRSYNGLGFPNFLRHEFLGFNEDSNTQYVNNDDELKIRVEKVDVYSR